MSDVAIPLSWPVVSQGVVIGTVVIDTSAAVDVGARSYSHDGVVACGQPVAGVQLALDIESEDNPIAQAMALRFGMSVGDFLDYWTVLECAAKLTSVPVHALFRQHPPHARGGERNVAPEFERALFRVHRWRVAVLWTQ